MSPCADVVVPVTATVNSLLIGGRTTVQEEKLIWPTEDRLSCSIGNLSVKAWPRPLWPMPAIVRCATFEDGDGLLAHRNILQPTCWFDEVTDRRLTPCHSCASVPVMLGSNLSVVMNVNFEIHEVIYKVQKTLSGTVSPQTRW